MSPFVDDTTIVLVLIIGAGLAGFMGGLLIGFIVGRPKRRRSL